MRRFGVSVVAISLLSITGCETVGVNYNAPSTAVPDAWTLSIQPHLSNDAACLSGWWRGFNDPALNELIERTRSDNPDFKIALQRIVEARAERGVALSALFPNLATDSSYTRVRESEGAGAVLGNNPLDYYSTGLSGGWEIDLFGGLRRGVEAADANIEASVETYRDLLVTLFADVALNYIDYRTFEERIYVANLNIKIQQDSLDLAQSRLDAGLVSKIDVTQARANLETTKALVPQLEGQLVAARNRLGSLTGGYPHSVTKLLSTRHTSIPVPAKDYGMGQPADLLRTRPDVRSAERTLAAAVASVGIAESELYPKLSLAGTLSFEALDVSNIPNAAAAAYSFGPSLQWNLFRSGQIKNQIRVEEAQAMQAYASYEKVVLTAVEEVETSMAGVLTERQRLSALRRAVAAADESVTLVKNNYTEGLVDFQRVIDTERVLFQNQDLAVTSKGQIARNYVALYRALGGGAALEEFELPEPVRKPGGGWIKKRQVPYSSDISAVEAIPDEANLKQ
ncbi:MAG: efflux transporter outer membrane subunit [Verrucomicrobiales bacterium]|nr:efflux transporter outer membrane subunit [Verrucomicrobiales bacterium]